MTPIEELKSLIEDFTIVRSQYMEFGAGDGEVNYHLRNGMIQATYGCLKVPNSGKQWELYTTSMKCGKATRALSASARKICNHIIKHRDSVAIQAFVAGYTGY